MNSTTSYRLTLPPVTEGSTHAGAGLLAEARQAMGMVPNMYANMANAPAMLATYRDGYARFRVESGFSASEQEVAFLAISQENGCSYCTAAHGFLADKVSGVAREDIRAILDGRDPADPRLAAVAQLAREMVRSRGWPSAGVVAAFLGAGFREDQVLHLLLAVSVKTISNYANHLFGTTVDAPFAEHRDALSR